jgi:thymidylate kinase
VSTRKHLICFIGMDGAGKTTLARALTTLLCQSGLRTRYVMCRFEDFVVLKPILLILKRLVLPGKKTDNSAEGVRTKKGLFHRRWLAGLWRLAVRLDYVIQLGYKVQLPLMRGGSICADRYVYDTAVDLAVDTALPVTAMESLLSQTLRLTAQPAVVFLLDLPEETAYQRNLVKRDGISRDYLKARRDRYLAFSHRPEVVILNGTRKTEDLLREIAGILKERGILI